MDKFSLESKLKEIPRELIVGINKLRTDQIESLLIERENHCLKFQQLKTGMIFTKSAGFDDEQNEILVIDKDMMVFTYIDTSIEKSSIKCSDMFEIPMNLYRNKSALNKGEKFIFDEPRELHVSIIYSPTKI